MLKKTLRSLSSVKLAIILFILLASASVLGTLIPQQRGPAQYAAQYGTLAPLLMRLQFTNLYHSIWFLGLLSFFALNTIVCTLTRLPMKWRKALKPQVVTDERAVSTMKTRDRWRSPASLSDTVARIRKTLKNHRYRVRESAEGDKVHLLARKRTSGHFGSDIVHTGLLIILAGGIVTGFGGFRTEIPMSEGEIASVPQAPFSLRLDKFTTEYYPDGSVKDWKSALTVLEDGDAVLTKTIEVNHPLNYRGFSFYQMSYGFNWDRPQLEILVKKKDEPSFSKTFKLRPGERVALEDGEGTEIGIRRFLPDFVLGDGNEPQTRSLQPNNPAALVEGWRGPTKVFEGWIFANFPDFAQVHGAEETALAFELKGLDAPQYSVLEAARDPGVSLIWLGCLLLMGGLALAFYWPPWEIRMIITPLQGKAELSAGGVAAKSRDRFEIDFAAVMTEARSSQ